MKITLLAFIAGCSTSIAHTIPNEFDSNTDNNIDELNTSEKHEVNRRAATNSEWGDFVNKNHRFCMFSMHANDRNSPEMSSGDMIKLCQNEIAPFFRESSFGLYTLSCESVVFRIQESWADLTKNYDSGVAGYNFNEPIVARELFKRNVGINSGSGWRYDQSSSRFFTNSGRKCDSELFLMHHHRFPFA
eukprot:Awhi_evm1s1023